MQSAAERVAITGSTGFVGRALLENLCSDGTGCPVLFGRQRQNLSGCDVWPMDMLASKLREVDTVVHLAAVKTSNADIETLRRVNVDLAVETARLAALAGVKRFVFVSTLHVHGTSSNETIRPSSSFKADNAYGRSKMEAEIALTDLAAKTGMELVIVRPPMIYGPGSKGNFHTLARLIRMGIPLPLGRALGQRSFCSLVNVVSAIRHSMDPATPPGILIPADDVDFISRDLIQLMATTVGRRVSLLPVPKAVIGSALRLVGRREMLTSLFDPLRVDRTHWKSLGWQPIQSGRDGVRQALLSTYENPLALYITNSTPYFFSHRIALARAVKSEGFRIGLAGGDVDQYQVRIQAEGIQAFHVPGGSRGVDPLGDIRAAWAIGGVILRERPAVVHASGLKAIFLCALARLRGPLPKVICIITGLGSIYVNDSFRIQIMRTAIEAIIGRLLRRSDTTVVFQNTDDHAYFLERRLVRPENAVIIRGSGVDIDEFVVHPEPDGEPTVVFPARLLKSKGVMEFAQAASLVRSQGIAAHFLLVGDLDPENPDALSESELDELTATGNVTAVGFKQNMARVFARSNLVCLPSYREGVPKALVEAASSGRAIVTTDVPGCREIVAHGVNGLVVPPRDPQALADAIATLLLEKNRRLAMGQSGRQMVEREFSLETVLTRTVALYGTPLKHNSLLLDPKFR